MWIVEFITRRIFFEPNMSHITKVSRKQPRTEDFFSRMLHPGVTCDQAIKATRWAPQDCFLGGLGRVWAGTGYQQSPNNAPTCTQLGS